MIIKVYLKAPMAWGYSLKNFFSSVKRPACRIYVINELYELATILNLAYEQSFTEDLSSLVLIGRLYTYYLKKSLFQSAWMHYIQIMFVVFIYKLREKNQQLQYWVLLLFFFQLNTNIFDSINKWPPWFWKIVWLWMQALNTANINFLHIWNDIIHYHIVMSE